MSLLFDENISSRIPNLISDTFPNSTHVKSCNLTTTDDEIVWQFARDYDLTIVTKDSDFQQLIVRMGHPPKVIWIRRGNYPTSEIVNMLRHSADDIRAFLVNPEASVMEIK